jgi:pSer/pThr/pTyr-binding forkhead associated (FHA) protein
MNEDTGQFRIVAHRAAVPERTIRKDRILIGRLATCDVLLDDRTVSRIHAGITFNDSQYVLANLSTSNVLTLNGRLLEPKDSDVLTDGDTIQIGPFAILVAGIDEAISLTIQRELSHAPAPSVTEDDTAAAEGAISNSGINDDVLKVFWDKRTRDKEDRGSRLRPVEKPRPGKAMINWRPTRDLRRTWRVGLFVWAFLLISAIGVLAFFKYPVAYAPEPLSTAHTAHFESSPIAATSNANSCTTCHAPNEPVENACIRCHQTSEFHSSNTRAHEAAGITCTVCHKEHQGPEADLGAQAIRSCSECHNDNNSTTYNGRAVRSAHGGSYGYPIESGVWKWKGVYAEVAAAIPEIGNSATGDPDEQAKLSRQFHTIHVARLKAPPGITADGRGLITCSSCHKNFEPVDRVTPRETCAACHTTSSTAATRDTRFAPDSVNCISCHVQHPFDTRRWSEFLTDDARRRRQAAVTEKIRELGKQ